MSAKHAVLGLVIERPGYGYDLARRLRERFDSSGFAPTGVYSALDQLRAEGLVRIATTRSPPERSAEHAGPRTVYEATERGREQFDRWMLSATVPAHVRDELNMKIALSRPRDLPALIELARTQEEQCLSRLQTLRRGAGAGAGDKRSHAAGLAWRQVAALLVRDAEARQLQSRIEWLQRTRAIMSRISMNAESSAGVRAEPSASAGVRAQASASAGVRAQASASAGVRAGPNARPGATGLGAAPPSAATDAARAAASRADIGQADPPTGARVA
jgi:DNA-binding PadR family transcriptional regulator